MKQLEGFAVKCQEHKVCKYVKSLYGFKQAPKQWHEKFDRVVLEYGFKSMCMIIVYITRGSE